MPTIRRRMPRARLIRRKLLARRYYKKKSPSGSTVYNFKRKVFLQDWAVVGATQTATAVQFALSDLPGYTDFTSLYDMYRIDKVEFKLIPKYTEVGLVGGSANNSNLQQIHSVIDYDDAVAPTTISQLCQYQSHKMTRGNRVHKRTVVPKIQATVSSLSALPKAKQWIDCDQTSVYHRGIKLIIPAAGQSGTTVYYDLEMTQHLSFKNVL